MRQPLEMHPRQPKSPHIPQPSRPPGTAVERSTRSGVTHRQLQTKARRGHGTCSTLPCTTVPMALEQRRGARPLKSPALPSTFTICLAGGETGGVRAPPCAHRAVVGQWPRGRAAPRSACATMGRGRDGACAGPLRRPQRKQGAGGDEEAAGVRSGPGPPGLSCSACWRRPPAGRGWLRAVPP